MTPCPSEDVLAQLSAGTLPDAERPATKAHADGCDACQKVLEELSFDDTRASRPSAPRFKVPPTVGRYEIAREIGRGAMGKVLLATDLLLGRQVALKLVASGVEGGGLSQQVANEARAIARLQHPNVVGLYDVVQWEGQVYLAMEFVEGMSLDDWLRESHGVEQIIGVFLQAAEGLIAAHEAGVVHRDFKPANVLVGRDGRVRVTDFGLANLLGERDAQTKGALVGTPAYMAPELFEGKTGGPQSDQFAFAVALHEALAGQRPFGGDSLEALQKAVTRGLASMPKSVPAALAAVVRRALSTDPRSRFESMRQLKTALERAAGAQRLRRRVLFGAVAGVALVAAAVTVLKPSDPCRLEATRLPALQKSLANGSPVHEELAGVLGAALEGYAATFPVECGAHATRKLTDTDWGRVHGCLEAALDDVEVALAASRALDPKTPVAPLLRYVANPRGCPAPANLARPHLPPEPARAKVVAAHVGLAEAMGLPTADSPLALAKVSEAVELAKASGYAPAEARALLVRARIEGNQLRPDDAARSAEQARALAQAGGATVELARVGLQTAFPVCFGDQPEECKARLSRVAPLVEAVDDLWLTTFTKELAVGYSPASGDELIALLQGVLEAWKKVPGAARDIARSQRSLLALEVDLKPEAALKLADELVPAGTPLNSLWETEVLVSRARALHALGREAEALKVAVEVEAAARRLSLDREIIDALVTRADILTAMGDYEGLVAAVPPDVNDGYLQLSRARGQLEQGHWAEARRLLEGLSFPMAQKHLSAPNIQSVAYDLVVLAAYTADVSLLDRAASQMTPAAAADPGVAAVLATVRGREDDARAALRNTPADDSSGNSLLRAELADREGKWAQALSEIEVAQTKGLSVNQVIEAQIRKASAELALGGAPADACARLAQGLEKLPSHRLAIFPWEEKRFREVQKTHCH